VPDTNHQPQPEDHAQIVASLRAQAEAQTARALADDLVKAQVSIRLIHQTIQGHVSGVEQVRARLGERPAFADLQNLRLSCLGFLVQAIAAIDPALGARLDAALFPDPDSIEYGPPALPDLESVYDRAPATTRA
jgi:hypothetical protein